MIFLTKNLFGNQKVGNYVKNTDTRRKLKLIKNVTN